VSELLKEIVANINRLEQCIGTGATGNLDESLRWVGLLRAGKILFYGHQEVEIGLENIDWTGPHVHHQEWQAQLNRFFWLPHLAAVYRETADEELPSIARRTIEDWINQHDYCAEEPPSEGDNTLNTSIRLGQIGRSGWWGTVPAFAESPEYNDTFVARMIDSTRGQLACLAAHLAPVGNWRISHLNCLLYCGLVIPGLEEYVSLAVRHLNETFLRQIHEDGSHEEHNPSYHSWMRTVFTQLWRLGRARPEIGIIVDTERAARMWDYSVYSTSPDGGSCGLHDGGVWSGGPGRIGVLDGRDAFLEEAGLDGKRDWNINGEPSRYFASAGQLFLRDGWSRGATSLVFDATRWGGAHCHLSRLSVSLYSGTRMLLYDPGIFSYEMSDPYASHGKSTRAHNTINLGGRNQTEVNPDTYRVHIEDDLAVIGSRYIGGYFPGEYTWGWNEGKGVGVFGSHDRVMLWLRGKCALVFDLLHTDGNGQPYASHWQFPAGPCTLDQQRRRAWTGGAEDNVLVQCLHSLDSVDCVIHEGEKDPLLGWLPDGRGQYQPAPLFAMEARAQRRASEIVTLLLPFKGEELPEFGLECFERSVGGAYGYHFSWPDGTEHIVVSTPALRTQVDQAGPVDSDGTIAVVSLKQGEPESAFMLDGLFLEFDGHRLIDERVPGAHMVGGIQA